MFNLQRREPYKSRERIESSIRDDVSLQLKMPFLARRCAAACRLLKPASRQCSVVQRLHGPLWSTIDRLEVGHAVS